jgi:hypothetical protein
MGDALLNLFQVPQVPRKSEYVYFLEDVLTYPPDQQETYQPISQGFGKLSKHNG